MTHTLAELRAMSNVALNRAVAELAGWTVYGDRLRGWTMRSPTGEKYAVRPGYVEWDTGALPDVAADLNAAWALFDGGGQMFGVSGGFGISECEARCADAHLFADVYVGNHAQAPRALTLAWCAWKIAQREAGA